MKRLGLNNFIIVITSLLVFFSCENKPERDISEKLTGKWNYIDCCNSAYLEVWFYKNNLLWYTSSMNFLDRKKYVIDGDYIIIKEVNDTINSDYPTSAVFTLASEKYFWFSATPNESLVFHKITSEIDSSEFYSIDREYFNEQYVKYLYPARSDLQSEPYKH